MGDTSSVEDQRNPSQASALAPFAECQRLRRQMSGFQ